MSNIEDPKIKNRSDVLQSIHTDILRCENIIAIGMSEGESEFMLGVSLPTLNDIVKINLSHALILAFVRLNGELSVSERLRLLFELLGRSAR